MSKNKKNRIAEENAQLVGEVTNDIVVETITNGDEETVVEESEAITNTVIGMVKDCTKLNIREADDSKAEVICVVSNGAKLTVDLAKSNPDWLYVETPAGKSGFCMAKYVSL